MENETCISLENNDIESLFSIDEELSEQTLCVIPYYHTSSETESYSESEDIFHISPTSPEPSLNIFSSQTHCPNFSVKIITSKFAKPITVIALIDTGASCSILDTKVLPEEYWAPYVRYFNSA